MILILNHVHAASKLTAEKSFFNFGTIREGMNAPVHFRITNTGTERAAIREIRTFAACVQTEPLQKQTLAPGESMELDYVFESLGYGGVTVNKKIEIIYDSNQSPLNLAVKGEVLPLESYQAPLGELTYNFFVLIDVRPPKRFIQEHVIGAINVPYEKIDKWAAEVSKSISGDLIIYLYCDDGTKSDEMAKRLRQRGFSQYISIVGGLQEWKRQKKRQYLISGTQ